MSASLFVLPYEPPDFGRPCNFVDERDTGTWECINDDCLGGHWFRRIETDEGNPA